MGSTKIINVLRDDTLKEILEVFRSTPAEEVIFVLPTKAKSLKDIASFSVLKEEAKNLEKKVSFLCSDQNLNNLATDHGFSILVAKESSSRPPKAKVASFLTQTNPGKRLFCRSLGELLFGTAGFARICYELSLIWRKFEERYPDRN